MNTINGNDIDTFEEIAISDDGIDSANEVTKTKNNKDDETPKNIENQIEAFLNSGGKIKEIPMGITAQTPAKGRGSVGLNIRTDGKSKEEIRDERKKKNLEGLFNVLSPEITKPAEILCQPDKHGKYEKILEENGNTMFLYRVIKKEKTNVGILVNMEIFDNFKSVTLNHQGKGYEKTLILDGVSYSINAQVKSKTELVSHIRKCVDEGRWDIAVTGNYINRSQEFKKEEEKTLKNSNMKTKRSVKVKYLFVPNPILYNL